jgi:hypothetical protein
LQRCRAPCRGEGLPGRVMEAGKRWKDEDIPKTNWDLKHYVWFPAAEMYGIQRIEYLDDVLVLCGAGVGGGSHVYGNTLYVPPKQFFNAPRWADITDWADELAPCYDQARRMLGVVRYPYMPTDVDRYMHQVAIDMGKGETLNELAMDPTVKPVALIADAIKDASRRSDLVLDPFCGSGSTIIAAETTGRRTRALEIDPQYVDVAIRRWQPFTGKQATLKGCEATFEEITQQRTKQLDCPCDEPSSNEGTDVN